MSNVFIQFALQIVPIPIGVIFMLALKEVKFPESKIKMVCDNRSNCAEDTSKISVPDACMTEKLDETRCADIRDSGEIGKIRITYGLERNAMLWRGYLGKAESMRRAAFRRVAFDLLIANGFWSSKASSELIEDLAFSKLGLIDEGKLDELVALIRKHRTPKIEIFASDRNRVLARLLSFYSESGGLLTAYLIGGKLDVKVA